MKLYQVTENYLERTFVEVLGHDKQKISKYLEYVKKEM